MIKEEKKVGEFREREGKWENLRGRLWDWGKGKMCGNEYLRQSKVGLVQKWENMGPSLKRVI